MKANHTNKTYAAAMQRTSFVSGLMAPICSELAGMWAKVQLRVEVTESPGRRPIGRLGRDTDTKAAQRPCCSG
jgi:hypothetical protein